MSYDKNKPSDLDVYFKQASDSTGVSYDFLRKLSFNESSFDVNAQSPTGPRGPMQMTKATARSLGLTVSDDGTIDERIDPAKAIPAAARHLQELTQKYKGDELKAALAYNQGEGRLGKPQLDAYDRGDFGNVGSEGLNYMRKLSDVSKSPQLEALNQFGGIRPKAEAFTVDGATKGWEPVQPSVKVGENLPTSGDMSMEGADVPEAQEPFAKQFWDQHHETLEEAESKGALFGTKDAVTAETQTGLMGMAIRAGREDNSWDLFKDVITPTSWNSHTWTEDELRRIRDEVKNPAYINVVTGGSPENLDQLIKMANENADMDSKVADAGWGAKLVGGATGAVLDPLSYVPIAGQAYRGMKLAGKVGSAMKAGAQTAGLGVLSERINTAVGGGEDHFAEAAVGGFVFGAALRGIGDAMAPKEFNPFHGPVTRLENRENARLTNSEDIGKMPIQEGEELMEHAGVRYANAMNDGDVRLEDGSIISASNPLNPKTQKDFAEIDPAPKAAKGIQMGGLTELGLKILSSEDDSIRNIGYNLVRSPTGMVGGESGKFGATASDIVERLHYGDNRLYNTLYDTMDKAMKDPEWTTGAAKTSKVGARQAIYRRVVEAIERPELAANLSKSEADVLKLLKEHFDAKGEMLMNPSMFGREAIPVMEASRHAGTYIPNVYSKEAKAALMARLGGADGLKAAIKASWIRSYHARPEVKARVDEYLTSGQTKYKGLDDYLERKAHGISHSDEFHSSTVVDDQIGFSDNNLIGLENNQFIEARNLFDSDMKTTLPDGNEFSVNDLRDYDMKNILPAYNRRVNGDIAIHGSTGGTVKDLKDQVLSLREKAMGDGRKMDSANALGETLKILTGRGRREPDQVFGTMLRSLSDLSFFAKNAYMGVQNLTEVAGMIATGNVRAMMHGIPYMGELAMRRRVLPAKELREVHGMLFGRELDDTIRPNRQDIIEKLRENTPASNLTANTVGTFKYATQEMAQRNPWTKVLNGTANYLIDAGRQGVLADVVDAAVRGKNSRWLKDNYLKSASITAEQAKGIKALIQEHVQMGPDGSYSIPNKRAMMNDPRAMDLWRLGDKVADEVMLRPGKLSLQDSKAFGPFGRLMLQFKSFTIKSLNSKFLRSFYEGSKNGRALDTALTWAISGGLAGGYYVLQAHAKAASLPKEQQKEYLDKALNPNIIGYAALSRGSYLGAPLGIFNLVAGPLGYDPAKMVRSSILPTPEPERPDRSIKGFALQSDPVQNFLSGVLQQVPGAGYAVNTYGTAHNLAGYLTAPNTMTKQDYLTGMMNTSRELVPNDPITQQILLHIYQSGGVNLSGK